MEAYRRGTDLTPLVRNLCSRWGSCGLFIVDAAELEVTLGNTDTGPDVPVVFEIEIKRLKTN